MPHRGPALWRPLLLSVALTLAATAAAEPVAPEASAALHQRELPALGARSEAALARATAAEAYFRGEGPWEAAFPELVDAPLGDPAFLALRDAALRDAAVSRASERTSPPPSGLSEADLAAWTLAVAATCDLEDRAAASELRWFAALRAGVDRAPGFSDRSVSTRLAELAVARPPDPPDPVALRVAIACADEATLLRAWRRAAWEAATLPGRHPLIPLVEAALTEADAPALGLDGPSRVRLRGLQDRLVRARPLLPEDLGRRADAWIAQADEVLFAPDIAAAAAWVPPEGGPRPERAARVDLEPARQALIDAAALEATLQADPAATEGQRALAKAQTARQKRAVDALERERQGAEAAAKAGLGLVSAGASVDDADRLALVARLRVDDTSTRRDAELRRQTADIREQTARVVREEVERRRLAVAEITAWTTELADLQAGLAVAWDLATLNPEKSPRIDRAYLGLRDLSARLHDAAWAKAARVEALDVELNTDLAPPPGDGGAEALADRAAAKEARHSEALARRLVAVDEQDTVVRILASAKAARRQSRFGATYEAQAASQRSFIPELWAELGDSRLVLLGELRDLRRWVSALPSLITDLTAILALLSGSLQVVVATLVWAATRRGLPHWVSQLNARLQFPSADPSDIWTQISTRLADRLEHGDYRRLAPPMTATGLGALDLIAGLALVMATQGMPIVSFAASLGVVALGWRLWPHALNLAAALPDEGRPSLQMVDLTTRLKLRDSGRWLFGWWFSAWLAERLLIDVLAADRLAQVANIAVWILAVALVSWLFWIWAPEIRAGAGRLEQGPLVRWATRASGTVDRIPRSAIGLGLLIGSWVGRAATELISSTRHLAWVGTFLARRDLQSAPERPPLDAKARATIEALDHGPPPPLKRALVEIERHHDVWSREHRGGLIALTSERDAGLSMAPGLLAAAYPESRVIRVPQRMTTEAEALAWLAEAMGLGGLKDQALVDAMIAAPSGMVVICDLHLLMMRRIGGFGPIRSVLEVLHATAEDLFFVCCLDTRTWQYLAGAKGAVDLAAFRAQIDIGPTSSQELGEWLLGPLETCNVRSSFAGLTVQGGAIVDPQAEARSRRSYLRVLEDAAQGRALLARRLWLESLRASPAPQTIDHALPGQVAPGLGALGDDDLFLLTALTQHQHLATRLLAEVLNRPFGVVASDCRRLEASGILDGDDQGIHYDIVAQVDAQVVRLLHQRAFI